MGLCLSFSQPLTCWPPPPDLHVCLCMCVPPQATCSCCRPGTERTLWSTLSSLLPGQTSFILCVSVCFDVFNPLPPRLPAAVYLKAQLCVSTPWMTSGGLSWGPLLTKRGPTTSGSPSREKSPILAQEWYVITRIVSKLCHPGTFIGEHLQHCIFTILHLHYSEGLLYDEKM